MEEHLVSIIVPVYNVEAYLDRCLTSIISQTYRNIEVILVDDGSTDQSGILCDRYQRQDERIMVIHKDNGGLSEARNAGIQVSRGSYIAFIDSDDYVHKEYIDRMMQELVRTDCDVVICGYTKKYPDGESLDCIVLPAIYDGRQIQKNFYSRSIPRELFDVAWNKLYRSVLFENMRFPKGKIHEDMFTSYQVLYQCNKICTIADSLYYYEIHDTSISRTINYAEKRDRILVEKERMEFYDKYKEREMFLLAQKAYFYLALEYVDDDMILPKERAEYIKTCSILYRKMLSDKGYTLPVKAGIIKAVTKKGKILRGSDRNN